MMEKLIRTANQSGKPLTFEIGSNSDLIPENAVTKNLPWTIEQFAENANGALTFPTKFDMVKPLLSLNHQGKVIFRMSVNPETIIRKAELGTSRLRQRIMALNAMCDAGYPVGILLAPVIFISQWKPLYAELISNLADTLSNQVKNQRLSKLFL